MIITDFNQMYINDLRSFNLYLGMEFEINDGKIIGVKNNKGDKDNGQ